MSTIINQTAPDQGRAMCGGSEGAISAPWGERKMNIATETLRVNLMPEHDFRTASLTIGKPEMD